MLSLCLHENGGGNFFAFMLGLNAGVYGTERFLHAPCWGTNYSRHDIYGRREKYRRLTFRHCFNVLKNIFFEFFFKEENLGYSEQESKKNFEFFIF